ncbi:MAG: hypothetical protein KC414_11880, partial [Romboutsia sp.]|nr:hypothetical protein [Romboutsia sp.]
KYAVEFGIKAERLIFINEAPEHITETACYQLADLYLDTTFISNIMQTIMSLSVNVPVLSYFGNRCQARGSAFILQSYNLNNLISHQHEEYIDIALELYNKPEKLQEIKTYLIENKINSDIFNPKKLMKHIESSYSSMYDNHIHQLKKEDIIVSA